MDIAGPAASTVAKTDGGGSSVGAATGIGGGAPAVVTLLLVGDLLWWVKMKRTEPEREIPYASGPPMGPMAPSPYSPPYSNSILANSTVSDGVLILTAEYERAKDQEKETESC